MTKDEMLAVYRDLLLASGMDLVDREHLLASYSRASRAKIWLAIQQRALILAADKR